LTLDGLKPIGVCRDYVGFHELLRERVNSLGITLDSVDEAAGLPDRFSSKSLGPMPARHVIGPVTLGPTLGALGLVLVVAEDPRARAKASRRWQKRQEKSVHPRSRTFQEMMAENYMRRALAAAMNAGTPAERSENARRAAHARWGKRRPSRAA
jgi:hypothetical protein